MTVRELNEVEMAKKAYSGLLNKPNRALEQRFRRWRELSAAGIDAAVTLEDAIRQYRAAPRPTELRLRALRKWVSLCTTRKELVQAYQQTHRSTTNLIYRFGVPNDYDGGDRRNGDVVHPAVRRWIEIIRPELEAAASVTEINQALRGQFIDTQWLPRDFTTYLDERKGAVRSNSCSE